jgi:hypothetical protein
MMFDGLLGQRESLPDFAVGQTGADQAENFPFARGEFLQCTGRYLSSTRVRQRCRRYRVTYPTPRLGFVATPFKFETFVTAKGLLASISDWPASCDIRINRTLKREGHMKSILDRSFRYTPSATTDLRKTFARLRRQQHLADQASAKETQSPLKIIPKGALNGD